MTVHSLKRRIFVLGEDSISFPLLVHVNKAAPRNFRVNIDDAIRGVFLIFAYLAKFRFGFLSGSYLSLSNRDTTSARDSSLGTRNFGMLSLLGYHVKVGRRTGKYAFSVDTFQLF